MSEGKALMEELLSKDHKWTLASDAKLLTTLESTSNQILDKLDSLGKQLDKVSQESHECSARFGNVNVTFLSLANTQFVENRVYEEDVVTLVSDVNSMPKPADKTKEEREIEFIRSISAAVKMGTSLLHSHFVKVEVRPEDFDEGDDPAFMPAPFYAAKDPYVDRLLPPIIGTVGFFDTDRLVKEDKPDDSISRSSIEVKTVLNDNEKANLGTAIPPPPPPPPPLVSGASLPIPAPPKTPEVMKNSTHVGSSESSGLFGGVETDESDNDLFTPERKMFKKPDGPVGSLEQSQIEDIQTKERPESNAVRPTEISSSVPKLNFKEELEAKLGLAGAKPKVDQAKPPPSQKGESVAKPTISQPSPSPVVKTQPPVLPDKIFTTASGIKTTSSTSGIFEDSEEDEEDSLFGSFKPKPTTQEKSALAPSVIKEYDEVRPTPPPASNIFAHSDEEDSDIFSLPKSVMSEKSTKTTPATGAVPTRKAPFGGISVFGPQNPVLPARLTAVQSDIENVVVGAKEQLVVPSSQPMVKSLFEGSDDSDDDLFANLRNQSANQSGVSGKLSRGAQVVSNNDLTAVSNPGASMIADVKSGQSQKPVVGSVTQDLPHAPSKQLSLFDDARDDDDPLLNTSDLRKHNHIHKPDLSGDTSYLSSVPSTSQVNKPLKTAAGNDKLDAVLDGDTETLSCPQKSRIRIPVGTRRPPSNSKNQLQTSPEIKKILPTSSDISEHSQSLKSTKAADEMLPSTNDYDPTDNMKSDVFSKSTVALQGPTSVEEPKLATPVPVNKVATITTEKKQSALISQSQSGGNLFSIQSNPSGTNKSAGKKNVLFDTDSDEEDIFSGTSKNVLPTMAGKLNEQKVPVVPVQKGSMKQAVISVKGSLFSDLSDDDSDIFASPTPQILKLPVPAAPIAPVSEPKKSLLFDDDDDEDLDIFKN